MLKLSRELARSIIQNQHPDFEVIERNWCYAKKGVDHYSAVIRNKKSDQHYMTNYQTGYKPSLNQTIQPYEGDLPHFFEIEWKEVVVQKWVMVDEEAGIYNVTC